MPTPLFWRPDQPVPPATLAVDGQVPGAAATYSHWTTAPAPPVELAADSSTAMAVNAARDAGRWLDPYATVAIDHLDADGLLAVIAACRPELARAEGPLLIQAAEAGDFGRWSTAEAYRLTLRLHQHLRQHQAGGPGWEQRALDDGVARAEALLAEARTGSDAGAAEREAAVAQVEAAIADLASGRIPVERLGRLAMVRWDRRIGRPADDYLEVFAPQDLPLLALSTVIPSDCFQLLLERTDAGVIATLDAPRHSWARTVTLPTVPWPDLTALATALQTLEPSRCRWAARPDAAAAGFVTQLATMEPASGALATSGIAPETIIARVTEVLG